MKVSTNYLSMVTQRRLQNTISEEQQAATRLASGQRIVRSADDPAGLAIATGIKSKNISNLQAQRNVNDGVSLLQVAEGTLNVLHEISGRLRELAMQSATDTIGSQERSIIDREFQQLKQEVRRLTESTSFNGNPVINGKGSIYELQVGVNNKPTEDRLSYNLEEVLDSATNFGLNPVNLLTKESSRQAFGPLDRMIGEISSSRAKLGGAMNRMTSTLHNLQITHENSESSHSKIRDADVASESANRAKAGLVKNAIISNLVDVNINPARVAKLIS